MLFCIGSSFHYICLKFSYSWLKKKDYYHSEGGEVDFSLSPNSTYTNVAFSLTLYEFNSRRKGRYHHECIELF